MAGAPWPRCRRRAGMAAAGLVAGNEDDEFFEGKSPPASPRGRGRVRLAGGEVKFRVDFNR